MASGFENCPISLGLSLAMTVGTIMCGSSTPGQYGIDTSSLLRGRFSRLFTAHFCFSSIPQMFIGAMLLYTMRQFERQVLDSVNAYLHHLRYIQLGPRKFAAFTVASFCISTLLQLGAVTTASSMGINMKISSGPYFLIYSLLTLYNRHVPKLNPSRAALLGGFRFSEKVWTYLFALQLLLGEGSSSVCAGFSGAVAGWMYLSNAAGLQEFRIPAIIERFCSPLGALLWRLNTAVPSPLTRPVRQSQPRAGHPGEDVGHMGLGGAGAYGGIVPPRAVAAPSEAAIQSIMSLGFDRVQAVRALQSTGNNVEAAANMLFSG